MLIIIFLSEKEEIVIIDEFKLDYHFSERQNVPAIAQLVERKTVDEKHAVIFRSLVRLRFAGLLFF
jgi:hypothetical protein